VCACVSEREREREKTVGLGCVGKKWVCRKKVGV